MESAKQMTQVGMFGAQGQDLSLNERWVHIVVLQNDILFQALDGIIVRGVPQLGQQDLVNNIILLFNQNNISISKYTHFAEATLAEDGQKVEIIYRIILKSRYYCGWRSETSGFLELWICVWCFCASETARSTERDREYRIEYIEFQS